MDSGLAKLVRLPFFSDDLEGLLVDLGFTSIEIFIALEAGSETQFREKFVAVAGSFIPADPPLDKTELVALMAKVDSRMDEVERLWSLIVATKDALLAREANLMMFGLAASTLQRPATWSRPS